MAVESFAVFAHFAVNQIMKPSPRPSSRSPAAPSRLHSTRPCSVVASRRFSGALCINAYQLPGLDHPNMPTALLAKT